MCADEYEEEYEEYCDDEYEDEFEQDGGVGQRVVPNTSFLSRYISGLERGNQRLVDDTSSRAAKQVAGRPLLPTPPPARLCSPAPKAAPPPPRPPSGLQALGAYAAAALRPKLHRAAARGADAVQRAVLLAAEDQKLALCTSLMKEVRSAPPRPAGRPSCLDDPLPHTLHLTPASRPPPSPGRWRRCSATTLAWKSRRRRSRPRGARRARRRGGRCGAPWLCASPRRARRLLAGSRGARRAARGGW
jgi:hypothetical protein